MSQQSVKVIVRSRPLSEKQINRNLPEFLTFDDKQKQLLVQNINGDVRKNKIFCFDDLFYENSSQEDIYKAAGANLVNQVLEGYNGTIFAYGQTGSGKTHTMMGTLKSQQQRGIIPRCFKEILVKAKSSSQKQFLVLCSFVQLYNQQIRDLLNPNEKNKLELRESQEQGLFIKDMKKFTITSQDQFQKYLKQGMKNRKTGETMMNVESSRSHAIFTIYVESLEKIEKQQNKLIGSKFNFVDLAGSQRQNKTGSIGDRFVEATKINLSLTALGKVISSLVQGKKGSHIPYRDSKLTRLLQDSLGGNAKTVMIATISPSFYNYQQTISTLKYASRAKYITNVPIINRDPKDALLLQYETQIKKLRTQLKQIQSLTQHPEMDILKQQNKRISKQHQKQKSQLVQKINNLQKQLITSPIQNTKEFIEERQKREQKLTFMEQNYKNLQEEVKQMRLLLSQLRRKYKNASKQIFQLEVQHQKQRQIVQQQCNQLKNQNRMFKGVLNVLFTEKQLKNILTLGNWQGQKYILPVFYFKDRYTLAFPCENANENQQNNTNINSQNNGYSNGNNNNGNKRNQTNNNREYRQNNRENNRQFRQNNNNRQYKQNRQTRQNRQNSSDNKYQTMTSLGMKAMNNSNPYSQQNSKFRSKKNY